MGQGASAVWDHESWCDVIEAVVLREARITAKTLGYLPDEDDLPDLFNMYLLDGEFGQPPTIVALNAANVAKLDQAFQREVAASFTGPNRTRGLAQQLDAVDLVFEMLELKDNRHNPYCGALACRALHALVRAANTDRRKREVRARAVEQGRLAHLVAMLTKGLDMDDTGLGVGLLGGSQPPLQGSHPHLSVGASFSGYRGSPVQHGGHGGAPGHLKAAHPSSKFSQRSFEMDGGYHGDGTFDTGGGDTQGELEAEHRALIAAAAKTGRRHAMACLIALTCRFPKGQEAALECGAGEALVTLLDDASRKAKELTQGLGEGHTVGLQTTIFSGANQPPHPGAAAAAKAALNAAKTGATSAPGPRSRGFGGADWGLRSPASPHSPAQSPPAFQGLLGSGGGGGGGEGGGDSPRMEPDDAPPPFARAWSPANGGGSSSSSPISASASARPSSPAAAKATTRGRSAASTAGGGGGSATAAHTAAATAAGVGATDSVGAAATAAAAPWRGAVREMADVATRVLTCLAALGAGHLAGKLKLCGVQPPVEDEDENGGGGGGGGGNAAAMGMGVANSAEFGLGGGLSGGTTTTTAAALKGQRSSGCLRAVARAMRAFPEFTPVQTEGCICLSTLAKGAGLTAIERVAHYGLPVISAAMQRHALSSGVIREACRGVANLTRQSSVAKHAATECGVMDRCLDALEMFTPVEKLVVPALLALSNLASEHSAPSPAELKQAAADRERRAKADAEAKAERAYAAANGGLSRVRGARNSTASQWSGAAALALRTEAAEAKAAFVAPGASSQGAAFGAEACARHRTQARRATLVANGAVPLVLQALRQHLDTSADVADAGCCLLGALAAHVPPGLLQHAPTLAAAAASPANTTAGRAADGSGNDGGGDGGAAGGSGFGAGGGGAAAPVATRAAVSFVSTPPVMAAPTELPSSSQSGGASSSSPLRGSGGEMRKGRRPSVMVLRTSGGGGGSGSGTGAGLGKAKALPVDRKARMSKKERDLKLDVYGGAAASAAALPVQPSHRAFRMSGPLPVEPSALSLFFQANNISGAATAAGSPNEHPQHSGKKFARRALNSPIMSTASFASGHSFNSVNSVEAAAMAEAAMARFGGGGSWDAPGAVERLPEEQPNPFAPADPTADSAMAFALAQPKGGPALTPPDAFSLFKAPSINLSQQAAPVAAPLLFRAPVPDDPADPPPPLSYYVAGAHKAKGGDCGEGGGLGGAPPPQRPKGPWDGSGGGGGGGEARAADDDAVEAVADVASPDMVRAVICRQGGLALVVECLHMWPQVHSTTLHACLVLALLLKPNPLLGTELGAGGPGPSLVPRGAAVRSMSSFGGVGIVGGAGGAGGAGAGGGRGGGGGGGGGRRPDVDAVAPQACNAVLATLRGALADHLRYAPPKLGGTAGVSVKSGGRSRGMSGVFGGGPLVLLGARRSAGGGDLGGGGGGAASGGAGVKARRGATKPLLSVMNELEGGSSEEEEEDADDAKATRAAARAAAHFSGGAKAAASKAAAATASAMGAFEPESPPPGLGPTTGGGGGGFGRWPSPLTAKAAGASEPESPPPGLGVLHATVEAAEKAESESPKGALRRKNSATSNSSMDSKGSVKSTKSPKGVQRRKGLVTSNSSTDSKGSAKSPKAPQGSKLASNSSKKGADSKGGGGGGSSSSAGAGGSFEKGSVGDNTFDREAYENRQAAQRARAKRRSSIAFGRRKSQAEGDGEGGGKGGANKPSFADRLRRRSMSGSQGPKKPFERPASWGAPPPEAPPVVDVAALAAAKKAAERLKKRTMSETADMREAAEAAARAVELEALGGLRGIKARVKAAVDRTQAACMALNALARSGGRARKALREAGAVPLLVATLRHLALNHGQAAGKGLGGSTNPHAVVAALKEASAHPGAKDEEGEKAAEAARLRACVAVPCLDTVAALAGLEALDWLKHRRAEQRKKDDAAAARQPPPQQQQLGGLGGGGHRPWSGQRNSHGGGAKHAGGDDVDDDDDGGGKGGGEGQGALPGALGAASYVPGCVALVVAVLKANLPHAGVQRSGALALDALASEARAYEAPVVEGGLKGGAAAPGLRTLDLWATAEAGVGVPLSGPLGGCKRSAKEEKRLPVVVGGQECPKKDSELVQVLDALKRCGALEALQAAARRHPADAQIARVARDAEAGGGHWRKAH